jgi:hypothetical protein
MSRGWNPHGASGENGVAGGGECLPYKSEVALVVGRSQLILLMLRMSHDYSGFGFTPGHDFSGFSSASNDHVLLICRLVPELADVWRNILVDYLERDEHLNHQMTTIQRWKVEWSTARAWSQWPHRNRYGKLYGFGGQQHSWDRLMDHIRDVGMESEHQGVALTTLVRRNCRRLGATSWHTSSAPRPLQHQLDHTRSKIIHRREQ